MSRLSIALAVTLATGVAPAWAEFDVAQEQKLLSDDRADGDLFGYNVALDDDTALIGAPFNDDTGSAYIFVRDGGGWTPSTKLRADDGEVADCFGTSVSLDGDTALIGAPNDWDNGSYSGSAYIFVREGGVWIQQAKLLPDDGRSYAFFGVSVSLDGDTALIAAHHDNDGPPASGSAYIFVREGGVWTQQAKLRADDAAAIDSFGVAVSLDGDTALIGALSDDDNGVDSGSAYVFTREDDVWTQRAKLLPDDGAAEDSFGLGVSLDGNTALIGSRGAKNVNGVGSGAAYVFAIQDGVWTQQAKLLPDDGAEGDFFGNNSLSVRGDTAVIGAPLDDDNSGDSGSAYVFTRKDGVWTQQAKLLPDDGSVGALFGLEISLDGDTVLIGAPLDFNNGLGSGSAYVFHIGADPVESLGALADRVRSLDLQRGMETGLLAELDSALRILTDTSQDNDHAALNSVGAFINCVEAQSGTKIETSDAEELIADAEGIIEALEGNE